MKQTKRKKRSLLKRREFCKRLPYAAIGLWCSSSLNFSFNKEIQKSINIKLHVKKEEIMSKKIKAVKVKVISQKGHCALNHNVGDVVTFTESGITGKICIHALYSMMPGVFAMMFNADFPWLKDPEKKTHACPDAFNPVVFEIKRIREK